MEAKTAPDTDIRLKWSAETDELPVLSADALHWRTLPEICYLTIGKLNLPMADGPVEPGSEMTINPIVRLAVTPTTLRIWHSLFTSALAEFEKSAPTEKR